MPTQQINTTQVEDIFDFESQFLVNEGLPVVISGAAGKWKSTNTWTLDALSNQFGSMKIPVRETDDEFNEFSSARAKWLSPRKMMRFYDYIVEIQKTTASGPRPPYAGNMSILGDPAISAKLGMLLTECPFPNWLTGKYKDEFRLWIGAVGQRSTIHNDAYHNFNAQIVGVKQFILFPPDQHRLLYPQFIHQSLWSSPIDPKAPNTNSYPLFHESSRFICELTPGDILFIPKFWWHCAETIRTSINVNRWLFTTDPDRRWWHQQDTARKLISYSDLLIFISEQFNSLEDDVKELQRSKFENLLEDINKIILDLANCETVDN